MAKGQHHHSVSSLFSLSLVGKTGTMALLKEAVWRTTTTRELLLLGAQRPSQGRIPRDTISAMHIRDLPAMHEAKRRRDVRKTPMG